MSQSRRPFVPMGSYQNKREAADDAKQMSEDQGGKWVPCKSTRTTMIEGAEALRRQGRDPGRKGYQTKTAHAIVRKSN